MQIDRELDRHPEAAREAAAIERVVEDREIDAGGVVQPPEPVPDELHRPLPDRRAAGRRADDGRHAAPGDPLRGTYLYLACISCANLVGLMSLLLLELLDEAGLVPVGDRSST